MLKKLTIEYVKRYIEEKHPGSKLLSTEYKNNYTNLNLICKNGHEFKAKFGNIQFDKWCAECSRCKKLTIEYVKQFIEMKHPGTILLSNEYVNSSSKLEMLCPNKHEYKITFNNLQRGRWCPLCQNIKRHTLESVNAIIQEKHPGAELLSNNYKDSGSYLNLKCENGHLFKTTLENIQKNCWCSTCFGNKKLTIDLIKETIKELHPFAKLNSTKYKNARTKLEFICCNNHVFKMRIDCVKIGQWCPYCSEYKSEKYIRSVFEKLTNKIFVKARPKWLINIQTNWNLELDGFDEETKIAFECQGGQHYKFIEIFHKTKEDFEYQQYKDNLKKELCKINNINLICVPAIGVKIDNIIYTKEKIEEYIKEELRKLKLL